MADGATATFDAAASEQVSSDQADAVAAEAFDDVERLFETEGLRELLDVSEDDEAKVGAILKETLAELQVEARAAVDAKLDVSLAELKEALKGKLDSPENRAYFEKEYAKAAEESQGRIDGMAAAQRERIDEIAGAAADVAKVREEAEAMMREAALLDTGIKAVVTVMIAALLFGAQQVFASGV